MAPFKGHVRPYSRVFVTQVPARFENGEWKPRDMSKASPFGEFVSVWESYGDVRPADVPRATRLCRGRLNDLDFGRFNDRLLLAGDPVIIGIVTTLCAVRTGGLVKMLKWDHQDKAYRPFEINMAFA